MENKTYKVPAENLDKLKAQVGIINKRVARLVKRGYDVQPVVINVSDPIIEKPEGIGGLTVDGEVIREKIFYNVEMVSPKPPKAEGWEFVAALTHVDDVGTVLRVVPGAQVEEGELKQFRNAEPICQHCNTKRKRNDTYILRKLDNG